MKRNLVASTIFVAASAALREPRAEHALGQTVLAVDVRGIDEVDARGERAIEQGVAVASSLPDLVHERLVVGFAEGHRRRSRGSIP